MRGGHTPPTGHVCGAHVEKQQEWPPAEPTVARSRAPPRACEGGEDGVVPQAAPAPAPGSTCSTASRS
jgi:hypothetical protein